MLRIVTVGGGTGSFTVLSGLKHLPDVSITAIVSMADDGGSTGVLRDELGVLPPGDVRQCLIALSQHSEAVRKVMGYRFSEGALAGHSFGNIFLAALEKTSGDFIQGVEIASEVLQVKGKVIPVTNNKAELSLTLHDDTVLVGENIINHSNIQQVGIKKIAYKNNVRLNDSAHDAIINADCIVLGPGNYYCSLVPNLIVDGFKDAILKTKAIIVFPVNLTNKQGHTTNFGVEKYVNEVEKYIGRKVDYVVVNNEEPTQEQKKLYISQEGEGVFVVDDYTRDNIVRSSVISSQQTHQEKGHVFSASRGFIRHDSHKLAKVIYDIINHHLN